MPTQKPHFKRPSEFGEKEKTEPVSTRILSSAKDTLQRAADKEDRTLSWLVARILEDYAEWLEPPKKTS